MALVRTKYSGELAVLSTWLCALLPWSVSVGTFDFSGTMVSVVWLRFLPFRFLYILGGSLPGEAPFLPVWAVPDFVGTAGESTAAWLWIGGVVLFIVPFVLSIAYYLAEERVEAALPVDPVRLQGALLLLVGLVLAAATAVLFSSLPGATLPLGTLFLVIFGLVLLRLEEVEPNEEGVTLRGEGS